MVTRRRESIVMVMTVRRFYRSGCMIYGARNELLSGISRPESQAVVNWNAKEVAMDVRLW